MRRQALERHQVWVYLAAVALGLFVGSLWPGIAGTTETLVWPVLAVLLYATFTQTPLAAIPKAFKSGQFLATALVGNFLLVPLLVFGLVQLAPNDPAVRLGLLLVLLVPCTDWFITFTGLGRGDAAAATALTPITLLAQLALLPVYLWLMTGVDSASVFTLDQVWPAVLVVLAPLALAALTEVLARRRPQGEQFVQRLGWFPVPLLAVVIFLVAAGHVGEVLDSAELLPIVAGIVLAYLAAALILAKLLAAVAGLPVAQGRTLAFSLGTRNSFIVLPFALALPAGWEVAAIVVVMQSLVELFGLVFYLWFVPRVLFRSGSDLAK